MSDEKGRPDLTAGKRKGWYGTWLPRAAMITLVAGGAALVTVWVFSSISDFLLTLAISFFVAFAMLPAVQWLTEKWNWRRGAAAGFVMVVGSLIGAVFVFAILNVVVGQASGIVSSLPDNVDKVVNWLNTNFDMKIDTSTWDLSDEAVQSWLQEHGNEIIGGALGITSSLFGIIFRLMTVGLFLFYILADFPRLRAAIGRRMPQGQQRTFDHVTQVTVDKVGGWVYSRGLLAAISAVFSTVAFMLIGLPYPLAMGLWVGVISQFIPTVGTYIAGAVPVIIALLSDDPMDAVWVILAITIYQQIENYLISPRVTKNTMDLHPAVAFGAAIVGASLLGGFGALIALPFAAAVTVLVQEYTRGYDLVESDAMESPEEYEARIAAKKEARAAKKAAKKAERRGDS
jgi:predicted PurR-regulated permease PerM